MSEDFKIQLNFKIQGRLDNLRANSWDEMDALLAGYGNRLPTINAIEALAGSELTGAKPEEPVWAHPAPATPPPAPTAPVQPAQSGAPVCRHGAMVYKTGISKKTGNEWKAWMCPSPDRSNQCDAQFVR